MTPCDLTECSVPSTRLIFKSKVRILHPWLHRLQSATRDEIEYNGDRDALHRRQCLVGVG